MKENMVPFRIIKNKVDSRYQRKISFLWKKDKNIRIDEDLVNSRKHHEFDLIVKVLEDFSGNRKQASDQLGVSERTLRYKLAEMRKEGYGV